MTNALIPVYKPLPITFERGQGVWLWDTQGNKYLDALGGIAVCALGHAHPAVTQAIQQQSEQLLHTSNIYQIQNQQLLAEKLTELSGMEQAYFCNSGAEANEAALKLCRLYGHQKGIANPSVIVMEKAFHGRTLGTLSASGSRKVQAGFEPLVSGFTRAPYNDFSALETIAKNTQNVVAVMIEPIQGEGGINMPDNEYLNKIRSLCDEYNWLMIVDEIQTGIGRTGQFFAYQHQQILPDIVTTAKALGNGIPIGACLIRGNALDLFHPGNHGSTFGGNPFACRVALSVLETIEKENLIQQAAEKGAYLLDNFKQKLSDHPAVANIRGLGLMMGIELNQPCRELLTIGLEEGILFSITADNIIRLLPAYITNQEELDLIIARVVACIDKFAS